MLDVIGALAFLSFVLITAALVWAVWELTESRADAQRRSQNIQPLEIRPVEARSAAEARAGRSEPRRNLRESFNPKLLKLFGPSTMRDPGK